MKRFTAIKHGQWKYDITERAMFEDLEICGIFVGVITNGIAEITETRQIRNIADNPVVQFIFDPQEYYDAIQDTTLVDKFADLDFLGTWHSHPCDPAYPSARDREAAERGNALEGLYAIYDGAGTEVYPYYWDGEEFTCIRIAYDKKISTSTT